MSELRTVLDKLFRVAVGDTADSDVAEAATLLQGAGCASILDACILPLTQRCPECGGAGTIPVPTVVEPGAWEAAVCRNAGLPPDCTSKDDARRWYLRERSTIGTKFETWWSDWEIRTERIASALLPGVRVAGERRLELDTGDTLVVTDEVLDELETAMLSGAAEVTRTFHGGNESAFIKAKGRAAVLAILSRLGSVERAEAVGWLDLGYQEETPWLCANKGLSKRIAGTDELLSAGDVRIAVLREESK